EAGLRAAAIREALGVEADAVVRHREHDTVVLRRELDLDAGRSGVLENIVERFLEHAVERGLKLQGLRPVALEVEVQRQVAAGAPPGRPAARRSRTAGGS